MSEKGWQTKPLGDLCDILDYKRKPITKSDRIAGPYPYYGATCIQDYVADYIFDEPLVLVGEDGAKWGSGEATAFPVSGKVWVNNHAHVIRPRRSALLDNWLIHYLNHSDLTEYVSGVTVPKLNQGNLREIPIPLPPLPEQRRIVGVLDEAFAGIATAKANTEKNLRNARELFESHLNTLFGNLDDGWVEKNLIELCSLFFDSAHRTPKYQADGVPALRPRDVVNGVMDLTGAAKVSQSEYEIQTKRYRPSAGDIVYSRELSLGWAAIVLESTTVCLSQGMCVFRPNADLSAEYLAFVLNSPFGRSQAVEVAVGTAHPHINLGDIKSYRIPIPPTQARAAVLKKLRAMQTETQRIESLYQQKLAALDALKKSLLHQAFSEEL